MTGVAGMPAQSWHENRTAITQRDFFIIRLLWGSNMVARRLAENHVRDCEGFSFAFREGD
jgi:hypothetical protein